MSTREIEKSRLFTRRAVLIGGGKVALLSVLVGRLYYLQIMQRERFSTLAEDNRISLRFIASSRGQVLDRGGVSLANNQQNYRVVFLPEQVPDLNDFLTRISRFVSLTDAERKRIEKDYKNHSRLSLVLVRDNLSWEQVANISLHMPDLAGVDIEVGEVRSYPFSDLVSHIIGYVGLISQNDKELGHKPIPGFRIGKDGIEKQYDKILRGTPGDVQLEVNARGRIVRELARHEPTIGHDLKLTIDIRLQQILSKTLSEQRSAAAIVMDVHTGAVYALASHPGFDPNLFTYGISQTEWNRLNDDENLPLLNKVVDGVYAPGSTFKIVTALAGLDHGILKPKDTIYCTGHIELGNHRFHCWKKGGHGQVNFVQAMAGSCDSFFYDLGKKLGIDRIHETAKRLGIGRKTGLDFPHERSGLMPNRAWKMATRNSSWQQGETLIAAIGQGYVLTTPLQLAVMLARIVNGGYEVKPCLVRQSVPTRAHKPSGRHLGFDEAHLKLIRDSLDAVVNSPVGTAHGARILTEGLSMAGKTGTAQVRRISAAERLEGVMSNDELPWKERDHALFVGYGPVAEPRYAAAVIVEHGGSGAHVAAPIVRDILEACQKLNPAQDA